MGLSEFCIRRPVFTVLLMCAIVLGGIAGYRTLSVSALPNIDFPTIEVTANLPGASPETMANSVATVLEQQFSTISGLSNMTSTSYLGLSQIVLQFDLNRSLDGAALDVQSAIANAQARLPKQMPSPPSFQKVNPADQPIYFIGVSSDTLPFSDVHNYADTIIGKRISTLPGVGQVVIYGPQKYAVRVQINPVLVASRNLSMQQIAKAVSDASSIVPPGVISGDKQLYTLDINGQPDKARYFESIIVAYQNGAPVRLKDVADIKNSVEDTRSIGLINKKKSVVLAIQRQPDANTISVVDSVRNLLPKFRSQIPESVTLTPLFDRSLSVRDSVEDVQFTLILSVILVVLVIFLFLRRLSATIIPALTIPISIIATYGMMALMNFSLNNVSLLALTLCVGFVVDDAIVVMENIARYREMGHSAFDSAIKGSKEIGFTILSMTLSLVAVFIPILFMGGVIGRLFREFAVTISFAILISGFVSLTLTPMLSRYLMSEGSQHDKPQSILSTILEAGFNGLSFLYKQSLHVVLRHPLLVLLATLGTLVLNIYMFSLIPKGFFPIEDTGFIFAQTEANQDISFDAMVTKQKNLAETLAKDKAVDRYFTGLGGTRGTLNTGRLFMALKPTQEREHITTVIARLRKIAADVPGIRVFMQPVLNISVGGRLSKALYQYTLQCPHFDELKIWGSRMESEMTKIKGLIDVSSDLNLNSLKVLIDLDKDKAQSLGISFDTVRQSLYNAFGTSQVGSIYTSSNVYQIITELLPNFQRQLNALDHIYIPTSNGTLIPLRSVSNITIKNAPLSVNHQGQLPSVTISFNLLPGQSLGDAVQRIHDLEKEIRLPGSIVSSFQGTAEEFQKSVKGTGILLLFAILVIYIILGMLYESYIHPITILSGLPSAGIGAILALQFMHMDLDIIGFIGMILLIGIVKKNAIMMIDFAIEAKKEGVSPQDAIYQACLLRFRPIMMTTLAALFGTLPIAIGLGAGSELRKPLGVSVVGGLLISQVLTLYITPVIYLYLERLSTFVKKIGRKNTHV